MKKLPDLKQLSDEAKNALIVELWQEIQKLRAALDTSESKPNSSPALTSSNSSTPPSKGFKPNIKPKPSKIEGVKRQKSIGRAGGGRHLHPEPDQIIVAQIKSCPQCSETVTATSQKLQAVVYDKIELPPIRPRVTRIELYGGRCPCCQTEYLAPVPAGMEPGSPFGSSIQSLVTYLRYTHAIGEERLSGILAEVFGLKISEGAIANLLSTVKTSLDDQVNQILQRLRQAKLICSDETSARVNGQNQWEWLFQNQDICLHVIRPSLLAGVISEVLGEHRPQLWVSDLFSVQKNHPAAQWQVCLAHQLRDCQYAIDAGDKIFAKGDEGVIIKSVCHPSTTRQDGRGKTGAISQ
jgi:transposase